MWYEIKQIQSTIFCYIDDNNRLVTEFVLVIIRFTFVYKLKNFQFSDSQIPDRNCSGCEQCCMDYEGWLQFQQGLYQIVKDPLFELAITVCIVLNTMFLAMEHHGMSESVLKALDIGNKVSTGI